MNHFRHVCLIGVSLLLLASCKGIAPKLYEPENHEKIDPRKNLTRDDYRNLSTPQNAQDYEKYKTLVAGASEPQIPEIVPILTMPSPPKLGQTKLVSIAVTDDVPLKDVLLELSRLADVDIEVDAGISGGVAFRAKDKPFNEVIERLADLAGLRYSMKKNVLRVERDTPYVETYALDFLNVDRSATSSINISTSVLSSSTGGGSSGGSSGSSSGSSSGGSSGGSGGGLTTGSQTSISSKTDGDFWKKFEDSIKQIVAYTPTSRLSVQNTSNIPTITQGNTGATPGSPPAPGAAAPQPVAQPAATSSVNAASEAYYTLNRQAATLTVGATDRQHRAIREFIRKIKNNTSAQVLIEAKIVEVNLNDGYQSGIDWTKLGGDGVSFTSTLGGVGDAVTTFGTLNFTPRGGFFDLTTAIKLTEQFGAVRTLSSPRLHAINNEQAVLTFARNEVYFTVEVSREDQTNSSTTQQTTTVNSTINTVPIGIIMTLLPSIDMESNEVTLNVRPTLSTVLQKVEDPGLKIALAANGLDDLAVQNLIPVVQVRELDSIVKLKSGQVMVIGGLMEDSSTNTESQIPFAGDVPIVGNLFRAGQRTNVTKELVIFIKATIVDSNGSAAPADRMLMDKFTDDPRPTFPPIKMPPPIPAPTPADIPQPLQTEPDLQPLPPGYVPLNSTNP